MEPDEKCSHEYVYHVLPWWTEKQQTTTTKPETKQTQPQGGTKYQTYHVTMNIDAQSIDDLRKLKKLLSELDGDNDPVTA